MFLFYRNLRLQTVGPNFHKNAQFSDIDQFFQNSALIVLTNS